MGAPPLCQNNSFEECTTAATVAPAAIALLLVVVARLPLGVGKTFLGRLFTEFLTLHEAETFLGVPTHPDPARKNSKHSASSITLAALASFQAVAWLIVLIIAALHPTPAIWPALALTVIWTFSATQLVFRPRPTPQYALLGIFVTHLVGAFVRLGVPLYKHFSYPEEIPLPPHGDLLALTLDIFVVTSILAVTLSRPVQIPGPSIDVAQIGVKLSPEDYTTLWKWYSFSWVAPVIQKGANHALKDEEVWDMSPVISAKPVFLKFSSMKSGSLLRQLCWAHSHDILIHFGFVYLSIAFNYSQPVFLNRILETINGDGSDAARSTAVIWALLMFLGSIGKSSADLAYLWISRRASGQIRTELMSAIYEKALKRKDLSGAVKEKEKEKKDGEEGESAKTGADIGKITNLMSNDSQRLSDAAISIFQVFGAPVEVIIASALLYNLLGWSAFAGFSTFLVILPINHVLTKRGIKLNEKRMSATDARMTTLNELVAEAKFIKFFSWEGKWINRTLTAREKELAWVVKERINDSFFGLIWMIVPTLVSVLSFVTYIYSGHSLTVPTAFTAIALFQMLQHPLNIIPYYVAQFLRWGVSVKRIENFLNEEEVPDFVSSLKRHATAPTDESTVLGFETSSFVYASSTEKEDEAKTAPKPWFWKRWFSKKQEPIAEPEAPKEEEEAETPFELRDIDVKFPSGVLTLVTGPTASGKSSLLRALLGEMTMSSTSGKVLLPKDGHAGPDGLKSSVSYAAQTPWLQHATIKENIVYDAPLDEERYDAVIDACCLKPDFKILEDGDSTEIGARGVSLSGGQRARVQLARAIYQHSKVVLLDDPLSAVDSHTARRLLDQLFRGKLLANRTVVLVTHHIDLMLPAASYIVRMLDGRVDAAGTVAELRSRGLLDDIKHEAELEQSHDVPPAAEEAKAAAADAAEKKKARQLVEEESRVIGAVSWNVYHVYLKAASYITWVAIIILIIVSQGFNIGQLLWIRIWGEASSEVVAPTPHAAFSASSIFIETGPSTLQRPFNNLHVAHHSSTGASGAPGIFNWPNADEHPLYYVSIYTAIAFGGAVAGLTMNIIEYVGAYRASKSLFKRLLVRVVRAPFRWLDTTPSGRILNRFSRDIEVIDTSLSSSFGIVLNELISFLAGIATIAYVLPAFLFPAAVIAWIYYGLSVGYLNTSRSLRRMEANSRSPVFESFSELLSGIVTVRAFSSEHRFLGKFYGLIDKMNRPWWAFWMLNRYLLFRFDIIGAFAVLATALMGLFSMGSAGTFAGWAGITITASITLSRSIYWCARFYTQLELDLNSVERIVEYLDIAQEPPAIVESNRPPAYWPSSTGGPDKPLLQVEDLTIKYAPDLPAVLHGVSFSLKANERVGLLGRTGSGKSTIAMSLLRFVDPASGKIVIDGIDITSIGLDDLRSNITFIPQDASLFSGTVRDNLDPFKDYTDEECAEVLVRVHLVSSTASAFNTVKSSRPASPSSSGAETPDAETQSVSTVTRVDEERKSVTLNTQVSAGGTNFSQGQRQLISLARALLRRSNIIIMDEATSSIDFETDAKIQATIREEFKNSLLLTVAHRLKTIADYDRLIVLDKGTIVEFDTPAALIRKEGGVFRDMALKSGVFSELEVMALGGEKDSS